MRPMSQLTLRVKKRTCAPASRTSANMSNFAAYLRYFGVLSLGNGHLRAQVPSKASVSSAIMKIVKAASGEPPAKAIMSKMMLKMSRENVSMSARYLMR